MTRYHAPVRYGAEPLPRNPMLTPPAYRRAELTDFEEARHEHEQELLDGPDPSSFPRHLLPSRGTASAWTRSRNGRASPPGSLLPPEASARPTTSQDTTPRRAA